MSARLDDGLHQRCENVEGGLRKFEKDFRSKYHGPKVAALARSQTKGHVSHQIYHQNKGDLRALGTINVTVDEVEMVQICLGGLA